jgi:flagella basal body P-ring formation protein FlgA
MRTLRALLGALLAAALLALPHLAAAGTLVLRPEVRVEAETVTLADLVEGASSAATARALFRAPALGESGTIQVSRVVDAAQALGISGIDTGGRAQVVVSRAARRIGAADIEAALKPLLAERHGVEQAATTIVLDGTPTLLVDAQLKAAPSVEDIAYDPRSRRLTALVVMPGSTKGRRGQLRVGGIAVETVEVALLNRAVARGEAIKAEDVTIERRVRENVPTDALADLASISGRVARRALSAGGMVRQSEIMRQEVVARGEPVLIVYEAPGLALSLRGKANEAGAVGDIIAVQNLQSKRLMQATIVGPGRVSVSQAMPGRLAQNNVPARAQP